MKYFVFIIILCFLFSCSKKKDEVTLVDTTDNIEEWEKFIGSYNVYDTIGNYLYSTEIVNIFQGKNIYGNDVDSLLFRNFADTFDLKIEYSYNSIDDKLLSIGIHDSVVDKNNKSWHLSGLADDENTTIRENKLINDTIIMYFKQTNIKYYIPEAQPYYGCECKHVAVKQ